MKGWLLYALSSALLLVILAVAVAATVPGADAGSVRLAAAVAYGAQLVAFAALVAGQRGGLGTMVGWGGGMLLRFLAVAGVAVWASVRDVHDPATALLSLVGFMMVLALLEPLFMRWTD